MIFYLMITGQFTMVFIEVIGFAFEVYFVIIVLNFKNEKNHIMRGKNIIFHFSLGTFLRQQPRRELLIR